MSGTWSVTIASADDRKRAMRKAIEDKRKAELAELRRLADEAAGYIRPRKASYAGREK